MADDKVDLTERFLATLRENGNNITGAAKTLGISRQKARLMAKKNGIVPNPPNPPLNVGSKQAKPPKNVPNKHTRDDELLAKLPALLQQLGSKEKVANALKTSKRTVVRLMVQHGLEVPKPNGDDDLKARLPELLAQYGSQARLATVLKIGTNRIRRLMRENGIVAPPVVRQEPKPKQAVAPAKPQVDRYAHIRDRLPQLFDEHKSQAGVARALGVDKKTIVRVLKATGYKPPQVPHGSKKGSTPFNGGRFYSFTSTDTGESVIVEFCADPKLEKARERLLRSGSQSDDTVWDVHQAEGVPLRDVYRLRYENRERAKGRM